MMEALLIATLSVVVTQAGLIWYKLGRLEGKIEQISLRVNLLNGKGGDK